ncbi:ATP-binding protein [Bifidobacterium vespertilionis]|uniref:ATP-binding protein n=1 Tax=Bifidobacterium vespertilionis TaxID=2562524 RepID=UPI001BDC4F2D|nr:ATP-binding protein [Bifidobacterium vespertilionis]
MAVGQGGRYLPRVYDGLLRKRLEAKGAVLVEGPKWCGKTTTCEQVAASVLYMADPAARAQNLLFAETQPSFLLDGPTPRLIDEWQLAPQLWDAVRFEVDRRGMFGQFLLTGSSVPPNLNRLSHTGTGRIARMRMRPMSLFESGDSTGAISLDALFGGETPNPAHADMTIDRLAFLLCRGGWPGTVEVKREEIALRQAIDYVDAVVESDISRVDDVERDPHLARRLLRSYARMESSQTSVAQITADVSANDESGPSAKTVQMYLRALEKIFVIEDLPAWNPNLRSKTAIRTAETRHFVDPSIAAAALGVNPKGALRDLETFGLLFEGMCVRDLRVYADALDGEVFHYRDKTGLECDAVIHLRDGRYGLVEVKLGGDRLIDEGAANLRKLADRIDDERMGGPSFLMVLTGVGSYSYVRPDGVVVAALSTLRP